MDANGNLICFVEEKYLYDDGTQSSGKSREITGPNACSNIPESCWTDSEGVWKCGKFGSDGETFTP
jgi:hypothetical protein